MPGNACALLTPLGGLASFCPLVADVQMAAAGERSFSLSADEYVFAALNCYTDCIQVFLYVLRVMAQIRGGEQRSR